jgi:hypothetical protein
LAISEAQVGIEAQAASVDLARRSLAWNGARSVRGPGKTSASVDGAGRRLTSSRERPLPRLAGDGFAP